MPPCDSCHAGCCRSFAVPVTGADILAIEQRLGLTFWDFVCRWADPAGKIALNYAPHLHFPDTPGVPYVLCLIHSQSVFHQGTGKCQFLIEGAPDEEFPLGQARCGIYNARPAACRVYPTKFNKTGDLAVVYDVPNRGHSGVNPVLELCPRQWQASDLNPLTTIQNLVVAKYEMVFFTQLAKIWNRSPRPWHVFPEFLHLVYANRLHRERDLEQPDADAQAAAAESECVAALAEAA